MIHSDLYQKLSAVFVQITTHIFIISIKFATKQHSTIWFLFDVATHVQKRWKQYSPFKSLLLLLFFDLGICLKIIYFCLFDQISVFFFMILLTIYWVILCVCCLCLHNRVLYCIAAHLQFPLWPQTSVNHCVSPQQHAKADSLSFTKRAEYFQGYLVLAHEPQLNSKSF